jgi:hypothetical protein
MSKLTSYAKNNPIATGGVVIVGGFALYRLFNKYFNKEKIPVNPNIPQPDSKPNPKLKYSYGSQQYSDFAKSLFNAMSGIGTDENQISIIFGKMKTYEDVLALIDAYGTRKLPTPYGWDSNPMTLSESLEYEMNQTDINVYVNNIIKRTGYQF